MPLLANMLARSAYFSQTRGDSEKARRMYIAAIERGLDRAEYLGPYGVLLMTGGEFDKALEIFDKAIALKPKLSTRIRTRINRAIAYTKLKRYEEAKAALEDIHNNYRSRQVYEVLGYLYVLTDDENAEKYLLEAYDYDSNNYVMLDNLCQYYLGKNDYANARKYGELAHDEESNKVDNLYHLALIEAHEKNIDKAMEYCEDMMTAPLTALNDVNEEIRQKTYKDIVGREYEPEEEIEI